MARTDEPIRLGPNDEVDEHPVTDTGAYERDIALLNYLLQDLRALTRRGARGEIEMRPEQVITWEVHGLARRTVVCDPAGLRDETDAQMVGFFGDRRADADRPTIEASEMELIGEFPDHPGILAYSSAELVDGYWANLVVHREPDDRETWRASRAHVHAVERIAPMAYHNVRIHNGFIPGGVTGSRTVVIESTKYWDYDVSPTWHAIRVLPGGETVELAGPVESTP